MDLVGTVVGLGLLAFALYQISTLGIRLWPFVGGLATGLFFAASPLVFGWRGEALLGTLPLAPFVFLLAWGVIALATRP